MSHAETGPRPTPRTINDRYRVLRELGRGGMGCVYLVEDTVRDDRRMALKTLLPKSTDQLITAGFKDEFAELAKVRHSNLAAAYDFGRVIGTSESFFTTEFIDGVELMPATKDATVPQLIDITAQLLRGLDFFHNLGLLHNDLKPANVLLANEDSGSQVIRRDALSKLETLAYGRKGRVKIIDFGLICREHTTCEKILGTVRYMSPERIQRAPADRRSDLYSVGVVLFVLFARRLPFAAKDVRQTLLDHLHTEPPRLERICPNLPAVIPELVHRLLQKLPEDRFATAAEALAFLGKAMGWDEEPLGSRWSGRRLSAGALLHRDRELEELRTLYDAASRGEAKAHTVVVEGPAGVGKSRLVDELRGHVQVTDGAFVSVEGTAIEGNLQPVLDAVLAGLRTSGSSDVEKAESILAERATAEVPLNVLLERAILVYTRTSPLVLHFDDFHRASETVRQWALELVHTVGFRTQRGKSPRRLLIVLSRDSSTRSGDQALAAETPRIELRNFDGEQIRGYVRRIFKQDEIPEPVLETIARKTGGNPLFAEELANHLVEKGEVRYSGSRWTFPPDLHDVSLPDSLGTMFEEKLALLSKREVEVLHWISAACHPLPRGVLARCVQFDSEELESVLQSLAEKSLVATGGDDQAEDYSLTVNGIRESLDARLESAQREKLHTRLAQSIAAEFPNTDAWADRLAAHWLAAGNEAGFLRFAPLAAAMLRERGDLRTAVEYHRRIARSMPDTALAKKIQSLSKLSEMHEQLWDLPACLTDLLDIQRLGERLMKSADRALLLRRMASVQISRHHEKAADAYLEEALGLVDGSSAPTARAAILAPRAWCLWFTGRHEEALRALSEASSLLDAAPSGSPKEVMLAIAARNHAAAFLHQAGRLEEAAALWSRNLEALEDSGQEQALGATRCALGGLFLEMGRWDDARDHLKSALRAGKELCDHRTLSKARERFGDYHLRFARFGEALQITRAALQDAEAIGNQTAMAVSLRTLGRVNLLADELDDARAAFERAVDLHAAAKDALGGALTRVHLARLLLDRREDDEATRILEQVYDEARRHDLPLLTAQTDLWRFVATWRAEGRYDEELIGSTCATLARHGFGADLLEALLVRLETAADAGRESECDATAAELGALTAQPGSPDIELDLQYCRGLRLVRSGEDEHGQRALRGLATIARNVHRFRLSRKARERIADVDTGVTA